MLEELVLAFRRITGADFAREQATVRERERLASAPRAIHHPVAQDYAAWRRSILWVGAITLAITSIVALVGYRSLAESADPRIVLAVGAANLATVDWLQRTNLIALCMGTGCVLCAALLWRRVRASTIVARVGWLMMFLTPFILAAIPFARLLDLGHLPPHVERALRPALGGVFALWAFFSIGPRAVALFPGIIRSALAVKTLLPESAAAGWVVVIIGPLYAVFLLVLVSGVIQTQASFFLVGGVASLALGPIVYVLRRRALVRPQTPGEAAKVISATKRLAGVFTALGLVLIGVFVVQRPSFKVLDLLTFLIGVIGNVVLLMAVGADFLIGVLRTAHEQGKSFHGTPLQASLDEKLDALVGGLPSTKEPPSHSVSATPQ